MACKRQSLPEPDRHELHRRALGANKSSKLFTNRDLDRVIAEFRSISRPSSLGAQIRQLNQEKTRLLWNITNRQSALLAACMDAPDEMQRRFAAETYIASVARDKFGTADLTQLSAEADQKSQLEMLRDTIDARINSLRGELGWSIHDLHQRAEMACPCAGCRKARSEGNSGAANGGERREAA